MSTASSTDWRMHIRHVPRTRLGQQVSFLLCRALACPPSFTVELETDREFDPRSIPMRATPHRGWSIPTRFPRRLTLSAPDDLQGDNCIRWRVADAGGNEIGQVLWYFEGNTFDSRVFPGFAGLYTQHVNRDPSAPAFDHQLLGRRDPRRMEEARGHAWLTEDEQRGDVLGLGAVSIAQMGCDRSMPPNETSRITERYVRELLAAWRYFPFLSRDIRYQALWLVGETASPRGLAALSRLKELFRAYQHMSPAALTSWCIERGRYLRIPAAMDCDHTDQHQATVEMLRMATQGQLSDQLLIDGLRKLMADRDHHARVEYELLRRPVSSGMSNPCGEIPLDNWQMGADLRGLSPLSRLLTDVIEPEAQRQILRGDGLAIPLSYEEVRARRSAYEGRSAVDAQRDEAAARQISESLGHMSRQLTASELRGLHGFVEPVTPTAPAAVRDGMESARQRTVLKTLGTSARQVVDQEAVAAGLTGGDLLAANVVTAVIAMFEGLRPNVPMAAGRNVRLAVTRIGNTDLDVQVVDQTTGEVYLTMRVARNGVAELEPVLAGERAIDL